MNHTLADIQAAHRKRMIESHPDRPNGNADKFARVQAAFEMLSSVAQTNSLAVLMHNHAHEQSSSDDEQPPEEACAVRKIALPRNKRLRGSYVVAGKFDTVEGMDYKHEVVKWIRSIGGKVVSRPSARVVTVIVGDNPPKRVLHEASELGIRVVRLPMFCAVLKADGKVDSDQFSFE